MNKFLVLFFSLSLPWFAGCVKILDNDLKSKEAKLVLNAAISTDSSITVNLSRTFNVFDDESNNNLPFVDTAKVSFYENGQYLFDLENLGYGYYVKAGFYPEVGEEYSITASYNGFESIESKTIVPSLVPIKEFDTLELMIDDGYYKEVQYVGVLKYKDPAGIKNQYQLTCRLLQKDEDGNDVWYSQYLWVPDMSDFFFETYNGDLLWNDKYSDGREVEIRFVFFSIYDYMEIKQREMDTIRFEFFLQSVNNDYYTYLNTLNLFYESGGGGDPFMEPVVIFSNIENGYGIFGAYNSDVATTEIIVNNDYKGGRK